MSEVLEDGRRYHVLEELSTYCTLGVRFWDAVTDAQIRSGLSVRVWPEAALRPVVSGARTRSDIYAFHRIPGLYDVERPAGRGRGTLRSPDTLPFVMEVIDLERRFVPCAISLSLPLPDRGLFLTQLAGSPGMRAPGFYLFSSPTRGRSPNVAVVRGELIDALTGRGAAHAHVELEVAGEEPYVTIANDNGEFALQFPFPTLPGGLRPLDASPPAHPVSDSTWPVTVSIFYQPDILSPPPGTELPDLRDIFNQSRAQLQIDAESPPATADRWSGTLDFSGELVLRTGETSTMTVEPAPAPP